MSCLIVFSTIDPTLILRCKRVVPSLSSQGRHNTYRELATRHSSWHLYFAVIVLATSKGEMVGLNALNEVPTVSGIFS